MSPEQFIAQYRNLVRSLAYKWSRIYWWIESGDLEAEGLLALMEIYPKDPEKPHRISYIFRTVQGKIMNMGIREFPFYTQELQDDLTPESVSDDWLTKGLSNPLQEALWQERLSQLEGVARTVVDLILELPDQFADFIVARQSRNTSGISADMVADYCAKHKICGRGAAFSKVFPQIRQILFA